MRKLAKTSASDTPPEAHPKKKPATHKPRSRATHTKASTILSEDLEDDMAPTAAPPIKALPTPPRAKAAKPSKAPATPPKASKQPSPAPVCAPTKTETKKRQHKANGSRI